MVNNYSLSIHYSLIVYYGDCEKDVENLAMLSVIPNIVVISSNKDFLKNARLHYSVIDVYEKDVNVDNLKYL